METLDDLYPQFYLTSQAVFPCDFSTSMSRILPISYPSVHYDLYLKKNIPLYISVHLNIPGIYTIKIKLFSGV